MQMHFTDVFPFIAILYSACFARLHGETIEDVRKYNLSSHLRLTPGTIEPTDINNSTSESDIRVNLGNAETMAKSYAVRVDDAEVNSPTPRQAKRAKWVNRKAPPPCHQLSKERTPEVLPCKLEKVRADEPQQCQSKTPPSGGFYNSGILRCLILLVTFLTVVFLVTAIAVLCCVGIKGVHGARNTKIGTCNSIL